ncbi:MAG TPA: class I SAM-dependent methyltransferase [Gammaproteobacteria bacterium]|nr:class I SAM-dependent methyltransferase [Gammaproteobacteria bacterium]
MTSFDRKSHWEQVYSDKSHLEVSWHQNDPALSLQMIENTGIGKDAAILDVGGGASVLVDHLHTLGYSRLAVLDISAKSLAVAQQRLGDSAKDIEWYEADITGFRPAHEFSLWHDRAVFHFLTEAPDREKYVATLKSALSPDGHVILAAFAIGGPTQCSGLDIVQYDSTRLLEALGDEFRLVEELSETHITPAGKQQKFSYFRLARRATG